MAARYVKNHSNYLLRKKHQDTIDGRIFEKDWVTIGSKERYYSRDKKKSYHGDSNFVFTTTNIPTYQKKFHNGNFVADWKYEDVKEAKPVVNQVTRNYRTNDIRSFAYYGSATELVRASIESIISTFPAYLTVSDENLGEWVFYDADGKEIQNDNPYLEYKGGKKAETPDFRELYIVKNPLFLDFWTKDIKLGQYDDSGHYLWLSWMDYLYTTDGLKYKELTGSPIIEYVWKPIYDGNCDDTITYTDLKVDISDTENGQPVINVISGSDNEEECKVIISRPCHKVELLWKVTIEDVELWGVYYYDHLVFVTDNKNFKVMPKKDYVERYFDRLEGFESCLLNRTSKPYFSNTFLTPKRNDYGTVDTYRNYTWPSNKPVKYEDGYVNTLRDEYGYPIKDENENYITEQVAEYNFVSIDVESPKYNEFVMDMIANAEQLDEMYSDNIWNRMVHEAIKNYDWSYSRFQDEDLEEQHMVGGNQVEQLLRVIGRGMDDVLNMSEGIKSATNITYDGRNNVTDAELSDKLDLKGWETYSTIPNNETNTELGVELKYKGYTTSHVTAAEVDNEFMRRFNLVSNRILSTKGTIESIDMIMGMFGLSRWNGDYEIIEEYRTIKPITEGLDIYREELDKLNHKKFDMILYYDDDPYSGVPLKEIYAQNEKMLVPYYDHHKFYDGEMYFQFKGGWGDISGNDYEYLETMTYMQVFENCHAILSNPNGIKTNEIVYVNSMSDYNDLFGRGECMPTDHYMICTDADASTTVDGWELVNSEHSEYERARYIDSLKYDNKGNNPHVGYGEYDNGDLYWEYMRRPFKFAYDDKRLYSLTGDSLINKYDSEMFTVSGPVEVKHDNVEGIEAKYKLFNDYYKDNVIGDRQLRYKEEKTSYVLNSKKLTFINARKDKYYKEYFNTVILKYLTQVIPSTTILVLKFGK